MSENKRPRARYAAALAAALGLGVLGFAGSAEANDRNVDPHYYSDYDRDHDGALDHAERDAMHYDRDGDGHLDPDEREKLDHHLWHMQEGRYRYEGNRYRSANDRYSYRRDRYQDRDGRSYRRSRARGGLSFESLRAGKLFIRLDRNRDGVLSMREVSRRARLARSFHRLDRSGDGVLSPRELDRYYDRSRSSRRYQPQRRSYRRSWNLRLF